MSLSDQEITVLGLHFKEMKRQNRQRLKPARILVSENAWNTALKRSALPQDIEISSLFYMNSEINARAEFIEMYAILFWKHHPGTIIILKKH